MVWPCLGHAGHMHVAETPYLLRGAQMWPDWLLPFPQTLKDHASSQAVRWRPWRLMDTHSREENAAFKEVREELSKLKKIPLHFNKLMTSVS